MHALFFEIYPANIFPVIKLNRLNPESSLKWVYSPRFGDYPDRRWQSSQQKFDDFSMTRGADAIG
jgi:hypothetical protein